MDRRDFMLNVGMTMVFASAYSLGKELEVLIDKRSDKVALLYGTRYGATKDTAVWIARGTGVKIDLLDIEEVDFAEILGRYNTFIIGSGIWIDGPHKRFMTLFSSHREEIESKIIASYIVCGTSGEDEAGRLRIEGYFKRFHKALHVKPALKRHFGGRLIIEKLSEKDRKLLDNFYRNVLKKPFTSWDRTDMRSSEKFGEKLLLKV